MSAILQSCIGKHQLMAKRMFSMYYLSLYKLYKATTMVASGTSDGLKLGVAHEDQLRRDEH